MKYFKFAFYVEGETIEAALESLSNRLNMGEMPDTDQELSEEQFESHSV